VGSWRGPLRGVGHLGVDYVSLLYTIDSHYPNKHTILHVFRARGYDLLVLLN